MAIAGDTFQIEIKPKFETNGFERTEVAIKAIDKAMKEIEKSIHKSAMEIKDFNNEQVFKKMEADIKKLNKTVQGIDFRPIRNESLPTALNVASVEQMTKTMDKIKDSMQGMSVEAIAGINDIILVIETANGTIDVFGATIEMLNEKGLKEFGNLLNEDSAKARNFVKHLQNINEIVSQQNELAFGGLGSKIGVQLDRYIKKLSETYEIYIPTVPVESQVIFETEELEETKEAVENVNKAFVQGMPMINQVIKLVKMLYKEWSKTGDQFELTEKQIKSFEKSLKSLSKIDAKDIKEYGKAVKSFSNEIAILEKQLAKNSPEKNIDILLDTLDEIGEVADKHDFEFFWQNWHGASDQNRMAGALQALELLKQFGEELEGVEVIATNFGDNISFMFDNFEIFGSTLNNLNKKELKTFGKLLRDNTILGEKFRENLEKQNEALWKEGYNTDAVKNVAIEMKKMIQLVQQLESEGQKVNLANVAMPHQAVETTEKFNEEIEQTNKTLTDVEKSLLSVREIFEILTKSMALAGGLIIAQQFKLVEKAGTQLGLVLGSLIHRFEIFRKTSTPTGKTLFKITEVLFLITPAIALLSNKLAESEIVFLSFLGKLGLVASVVFANFAAAVNTTILAVSKFTVSIGDKLIRRMEIFSASAEKAEETTSAFRFTILGFNRVVGESTGTLDFWNEQIQDLVEVTSFGVAEIQKSVALLVKEGAALGLNAQQNAKLLKIAADVAAATGKDLNDVTLRIVSGLAGQTQGLLALGINVKQAALENSVWTRELGKTAGELSETEAKLVRFNEIIKQTEPLLGAAENQLDTVRGANAAYERTLENIRIKLGETNQATKAYQRTITEIAETFLNLPDAVLTVAGVFLDFGGVTLKIIGTLTKYILTIGIAVTAISFLNTALGTSITLQSILGAAFVALGAKVGVATVAITGLSSVLLNLGIILKGTLLVGIKFIISGITALTVKIATLTATILTNPLFLAGAAIAASLYLIGTELKNIFEELELFNEEAEKSTETVKDYTDVLTTLKNVAKAVYSVLKDVATLISVGLVTPVLFAVKAWLHLKKAMADNKNEAFGIEQEIQKVNERLEKLGEISVQAQKNFTNVFGSGTAKAATANRIEYEKIGKATEEFASKLDRVKSITKELNAEFAKANLGSQFDIAANRIVTARTAYNQLLDDFINGGKDTKASIEDIKTAYGELLQSFQEAQRLSNQTYDSLIAGAKRLEIELLKSSGKILEVAKIEGEQRLKLFDDQVANLKTLGMLSLEEERKLASARLSIIRKNQSDIDKIVTDREKARIAAVANIAQKNQAFDIQRLESENRFIDAQRIKNEAALTAFDAEIAKMKDMHDLRKEDIDLINETRDALLKRNEAALGEAAEKQQKAAQDAAGEGGVQLFGEQQVKLISSAFGDAAGQLAGAASAFMAPVTGMMAAAQMIVGAIQQLIDFLPNFINSVANVFNSLTDLPNSILDAVLNLESAIGNFIENFIPNLIKALPKIVAALNRLSGRLLGMGISMAIQMLRNAPQMIREIGEAMVEGFVDGLKLAANDIANALGFEDIFDIKADEKLKQIGDQIKRASDQLFKVVELEQVSRGLDIADRIRNALASGSSKGASFFERLFKKIKKFGKDLWEGFKEAVGTAANWFKEKGGAIWNGLKEKAGEVVAWMKEKGKAVWEGLKEEAGKITEAFKKFGGAIWDGLKTAAIDAIEYFKEKGAAIWNGLKEKAGAITEFMKEKGKDIWNGLSGEVGKITETFKKFGVSIWDGLKTAAGDATEDLKELGRRIWDGLRDAIQWPSIDTPGWLQSFIDAVNSLTNWSLPFSSGGLVGKVENRVSSSFGDLGNKVATVVKNPSSIFASTGGHIVGNSLQVPTGSVQDGILYAQTGSMAQGTDTIPAMLTPGEFVVNREATRNNLGLLSFINQNKDSVAPSAPQTSTFNITINAKTNLTADQVRREVVPEIEKHLRRKSQEGRSVINAAGIRT